MYISNWFVAESRRLSNTTAIKLYSIDECRKLSTTYMVFTIINNYLHFVKKYNSLEIVHS